MHMVYMYNVNGPFQITCTYTHNNFENQWQHKHVDREVYKFREN